MKIYRYILEVEANSEEMAEEVVAERIYHEEDYGFEYTILAQKLGAFNIKDW